MNFAWDDSEMAQVDTEMSGHHLRGRDSIKPTPDQHLVFGKWILGCPPSATPGQHQTDTGSAPGVWEVDTEMLGPPSATPGQHQTDTGSAPGVWEVGTGTTHVRGINTWTMESDGWAALYSGQYSYYHVNRKGSIR